MSRVTNVIVSVPVSCRVFTAKMEDDTLKKINKFFSDGKMCNKKPGLVAIDSPTLPVHWYGGDKFLEACLYVGAFNNLPLSNFIKHLGNVSKGLKRFIQVFVKEDDDNMFTLINVSEYGYNKYGDPDDNYTNHDIRDDMAKILKEKYGTSN